MAMLTTWMRSSIATYLDNPTSRRDYRAQLRGNRAVILWTVYLFMLIGIGMLNYASSTTRGEVSIVEAQRSLQDFYQLVMALLAGMIVMVAPALAATTIVAEKERRSLDLVFSAPVKPKTLLVGKMISAYRYTWMLLVLSLPVTSVCVVLGGATWGEVLAAYALLSLHAMLYSAIGLNISALANKPVGALVWTYIAIGAYSLITSGTAFGSFAMGAMYGGSTNEAPFTIALSPFAVVQAASTHTTMFGVAVPNWILFGIYALFVSRFLLLGAASVLSPYNSYETKNLRITSIIAAGLFGFLFSWLILSAIGARPTFGGSMSPVNTDLIAGNILAIIPLGLLITLPYLSCSGNDGERKFWPNGLASFKEAIRGTPAGALPFLTMIVLSTALGVLIAHWWTTKSMVGEIFFSSIVWSLGFWIFCWSFGRWASATSFELKAARTIHLAALIIVLGLPLPFLAIIDSEMSTPLWKVYPLSPLFISDDSNAAVTRLLMGSALILLGLLVAVVANRKLKMKLSKPPVLA